MIRVPIPLTDPREMPEDPDEKEKWLLKLCEELEKEDATDANQSTQGDNSDGDGGTKRDGNKPDK